MFFFKSNYYTSVINGRGRSRGEARGAPPPLVLDQIEARLFFETAPPPLIQGSGWRPPSPPPPLSEVLDPPLNGVGEGHRCCSRLNLKISLKTKFVWVGLAEANWFNYTDLVASTGKRQTGGQTGSSIQDQMLRLPGFLHWWNWQEPKHATDRTQMSDEEWWCQQSHCWAPFKDETSNWLGLCDMYNVFYRLPSTSYFRKLVYQLGTNATES